MRRCLVFIFLLIVTWVNIEGANQQNGFTRTGSCDKKLQKHPNNLRSLCPAEVIRVHEFACLALKQNLAPEPLEKSRLNLHLDSVVYFGYDCKMGIGCKIGIGQDFYAATMSSDKDRIDIVKLQKEQVKIRKAVSSGDLYMFDRDGNFFAYVPSNQRKNF